MRVKDERLFHDILLRNDLGQGAEYMRCWWNCERVYKFICRVLKTGVENKVRDSWRLTCDKLELQSGDRARDIQLWQFVFSPIEREQPECRSGVDVGKPAVCDTDAFFFN